jgi:hypothetical protein
MIAQVTDITEAGIRQQVATQVAKSGGATLTDSQFLALFGLLDQARAEIALLRGASTE